MVPLARVSGAPLHSSMKKLLAISRSTGHRRIPLFEGNSSNTTEVAVWAIWDELDPGFATSRLRDHSLKPYFASPVQRLDELMPVLLARKDRMAIVVDEFGSAAGIVTVEDLMMILLGDVARGVHLGPGGWGSSPELSRLADNIVVMDAQARLLDAAELLDLDLPSRDYHTLAGFLTSNLGRIPIEGVVVEAYGYPFTVVEGSTRAPHRIRIEPA